MPCCANVEIQGREGAAGEPGAACAVKPEKAVIFLANVRNATAGLLLPQPTEVRAQSQRMAPAGAVIDAARICRVLLQVLRDVDDVIEPQIAPAFSFAGLPVPPDPQ